MKNRTCKHYAAIAIAASRRTEMARLRTLKPSFFTNEDLVSLPMSARLLFAGLWTVADRRGRLEDRPTKIKFQLFPGDDVDTNELLSALDEKGLILRYTTADTRYIQIINFEKHQAPHINEAESIIPAPDGYCAPTVQAPKKSLAAPPVNLNRLPSSVNREPSSVNLDPETHSVEGAPAAAGAPPRRRPPASKGSREKPKGPNLTPIFDAFAEAEISVDHLRANEKDRGFAVKLLQSGVPPGDLAECWGDVRAGRYGNDYERRKMSFELLCGANYIGNWQDWRDRGKPPEHQEKTNGRANGATWRSGPDRSNPGDRDLKERLDREQRERQSAENAALLAATHSVGADAPASGDLRALSSA